MNDDSTRRRGKSMRSQGFSLASILLLTAVVAVFFSAVRTGIAGGGRLDEDLIAVFGVGGSIVGAVVGVGIGLNQVRRIRGAMLGACAGVLSGAMAGVLLAVPRGLPAVVAGALVLVVFGGVVRFFSKGPPPEKWP